MAVKKVELFQEKVNRQHNEKQDAYHNQLFFRDADKLHEIFIIKLPLFPRCSVYRAFPSGKGFPEFAEHIRHIVKSGLRAIGSAVKFTVKRFFFRRFFFCKHLRRPHRKKDSIIDQC